MGLKMLLIMINIQGGCGLKISSNQILLHGTKLMTTAIKNYTLIEYSVTVE